jgi:hypothetical protein
VQLAQSDLGGQAWRTGAATGDDLDHAADRIGAVQARRRSAQDLDALDLRQRDAGEVDLAERRRADPHAIDQHQRAARADAAQQDRRRLAGPPLRDSWMPPSRRNRSSTESALDGRMRSASITTMSPTIRSSGVGSRLPVMTTGASPMRGSAPRTARPQR